MTLIAWRMQGFTCQVACGGAVRSIGDGGDHFHARVADRDRVEFHRIVSRMRLLLLQRRYLAEGKQRHALDVEYAGLVEKKLAFEQAHAALTHVYTGGQGDSHTNAELALRYLRQGTSYGFPSALRGLGTAHLYGLLGLPQNQSKGLRLLYGAAIQGDHTAEYLLGDLYAAGLAVPKNLPAAKYWFSRAAAYRPQAAARLDELQDPTG